MASFDVPEHSSDSAKNLASLNRWAIEMSEKLNYTINILDAKIKILDKKLDELYSLKSVVLEMQDKIGEIQETIETDEARITALEVKTRDL